MRQCYLIISSMSRDTLSLNETHEKENFDDCYITILYTNRQSSSFYVFHDHWFLFICFIDEERIM